MRQIGSKLTNSEPSKTLPQQNNNYKSIDISQTNKLSEVYCFVLQ